MNNVAITLIVTGLIAFLVSFFLTPQVKRYALKRGWAVPPNPRKIHKVPMVSIGGVAIYIGFVAAVVVALALWHKIGYWRPEDLWRIGLLLVGGTLLAAVSFVDDIKDLPPLPRLLCQFLAACIVVVPELFKPTNSHYWELPSILTRAKALDGDGPISIGAIINSINISDHSLQLAILSVPFTLFWIMGMTNTVNWIDGLDGLAGGVVFIGAITLFLENIFVPGRSSDVFPMTSSILALALACAVLGFLPYNWHPAKLFMGDVGAMFLGYALAVISIIDGAKVGATLLLIGFPILDVAWVITNRLLHHRSPFRPDRTHFHQRMLDLGLTQRQIVTIFYAICGSFGAVGIFVRDPLTKLMALLILGLIMAISFFYIASHSVKVNSSHPDTETETANSTSK